MAQQSDERTIIEFKIGEAFPADEPLARWLTALAMGHNDLMHGNRQLTRDAQTSAERMYYFRLVASHFYEIVDDLKRDQQAWASIQQFIDKLDEQARRDLKTAVEVADELERRLGIVRNTMFHYPELDRRDAAKGREKLQNALKDAAELKGTAVVGGDFGDIRFDYADEVIVQFMGDDAEIQNLTDRLKDGVIAFWRFTHAAFKAYLNALPEGVVRVKE